MLSKNHTAVMSGDFTARFLTVLLQSHPAACAVIVDHVHYHPKKKNDEINIIDEVAFNHH